MQRDERGVSMLHETEQDGYVVSDKGLREQRWCHELQLSEWLCFHRCHGGDRRLANTHLIFVVLYHLQGESQTEKHASKCTTDERGASCFFLALAVSFSLRLLARCREPGTSQAAMIDGAISDNRLSSSMY